MNRANLLNQLARMNVPAAALSSATTARNRLPAAKPQPGPVSSQAKLMSPEDLPYGDRLMRGEEMPFDIGGTVQLPAKGAAGLIKLAKGFSVKRGFAGLEDAFEMTGPSGEKLVGYFRNADFPGQRGVGTRGEIFHVKVPAAEQRKGKGLAIVKEALAYLRDSGAKTVNTSPTTASGRALDRKLIDSGMIEGPIRTSPSGKSEFNIPAARGRP